MKLLDDLTFMRNRAFSPDVRVPRLKFYHIPQTGGLYVYNALGSKVSVVEMMPQLPTPSSPASRSGGSIRRKK